MVTCEYCRHNTTARVLVEWVLAHATTHQSYVTCGTTQRDHIFIPLLMALRPD